MISRRDFLPFGQEIPNADEPGHSTSLRTSALKYSADDVRQKFTGYQKDEESGLDFAEARMYENRHGRFTAIDPLLASGKSVNPQTFNRYVYVMNSPLNFTDPTGLQAGSWFVPQNPDGVLTGVYVLNGQSAPDGYIKLLPAKVGVLAREALFTRVIGSENTVIYYNPDGPIRPVPSLNPVMDVRNFEYAVEKLFGDSWINDGWRRAYCPCFDSANPIPNFEETVGVRDVSLEVYLTLLPAVRGTANIASNTLRDAAAKSGTKTLTEVPKITNVVPEGKLANHLFKGVDKLPDTPANRTLIQDISNGTALGVDGYGKSWFARTLENGTQIYTYTQNGIVKGAGINPTPVDLIVRYGLK